MSGKEDRIRARAYELWEREGRAHGNHEYHWQEATRQVEAEIAGEAGAAPLKATRKTSAKTAMPRTPKSAAVLSTTPAGDAAASKPARASRAAKPKPA
ncbi:MAG: DUF2934 domain-containing protein [Hyphomicrobiales bacterium]|jgi:hypothetical protein|nr:DUF2934 domain-containing protein [Hyphomicrobiales bacterium]